MSEHEQVELPELGFMVDRGLEELIRACWHRGIATVESCIGPRPGRADAILIFPDAHSTTRFEWVTDAPTEWVDEEEDEDGYLVGGYGFTHFERSDIGGLVNALRDPDTLGCNLSEGLPEDWDGSCQAHGCRRRPVTFVYAPDADPFEPFTGPWCERHAAWVRATTRAMQ